MMESQLHDWEGYDARYAGEAPWQPAAAAGEAGEAEAPGYESVPPGPSPFEFHGGRAHSEEAATVAESYEATQVSSEANFASAPLFQPETSISTPKATWGNAEVEIPAGLSAMPANLALHQLLHAPETQQVSLASLLGKGARRTVQIDGSPVSIPAYLRLISRLSNEVAEQNESEGTPGPVNCVPDSANKVISGYPEYANQLDGAQRALLSKLAQEIVDSFATAKPIRVIRVVGHADTALRIPLGQREKFELDVSIKRAQAAEHDLRAEIERLGKGRNPEPIKLITFLPLAGLGSTQKLYPHAANETQMRANRRVEVFFTYCDLPKPWTWEDSAKRGLAIVPSDTDPRKRVRCMLSLLLTQREKAMDWYLDYQTWKHLFFPPGFSEDQKRKLIEASTSHLRPQLGVRSVYGPDIPDQDFIQALESIDEVITRSMRDFKLNAEAGGIGASVLIVRGWKLIQLNRTNPNSIYSCYASYSW